MCNRDRERYEKELRHMKEGTWNNRSATDSQQILRNELADLKSNALAQHGEMQEKNNEGSLQHV